MLLGNVASNKSASVRIKYSLIGNIKDNRDRELERVTELAKKLS